MRHVSFLCDDFQPLNRLCVADNIVEENWAIFFHPANSLVKLGDEASLGGMYHGSSYVVDELATALEAELDDSPGCSGFCAGIFDMCGWIERS
jgi:hypothetical protein